MPGPAAQGVSVDKETDALRRLHRDGVPPRLEFSFGGFKFAPHAVHMHRVGHHGVVMKNDAYPLAMAKMYRCRLTEFEPVERPRIAFHVARQMQFDFPLRTARIERPTDRVQVGQRQNAAAVVAQADTRIVQIGSCHILSLIHI